MLKITTVRACTTLLLLLATVWRLDAQIAFKNGTISPGDLHVLNSFDELTFGTNSNGENGVYVLIQFDELPDDEFKKLHQSKFELIQFIPVNTFYSWIPQGSSLEKIKELGVKVFDIKPEWKLDRILTDLDHNQWFNKENDRIAIRVYSFNNEAKISLLESGANLIEIDPLSQSISIEIDRSKLGIVTSQNNVYWVEPIQPELELNNLVERTSHRVPSIERGAGVFNLSGKGVAVGEWDGTGADKHIDYDFRHKQMEPFSNTGGGRHATHVAGTVLSAGVIDPNAKGMAPEALLYSYNFGGNIPREMDTAANRYDLRLTQNSYSYGSSSDPCSRRGTYDGTSSALDKVTNRYPHLLHVFAAGNSRSSNCKSGGYGTVHSGFQASKNSLVVAATTYLDGNSSFHSYGPTRDGRLKPEISAVGVNVYSTFPNNTYRGGYNGTSMACPGVSGTAALIHELYENKFSKYMPAHLLKGVLCNGADELGRPGPDYQYGFGRINARRAADIVEDENFWLKSVNKGQTFEDTIFVQDFPHEVKILLCWNDLESATSSGSALVNDLDLEVIDSAGNKYLPWVLNPTSYTANAVRGIDKLNNIEQVTIASPSSGYFIVRVKASRLVSSSQSFSVNWLSQDTGILITYPDGGETWRTPYNSAYAQTLRWDSYGLNGTTKVEFSADDGKTWSTLSSGVTSTRKYHRWSNASYNLSTSQALIRVTKGGSSDQSNNVFNIGTYGPTPTAVACDSQLHLTWNAVPGAASYKVYLLDSGQMKLMGNTNNRFFTLRGLANGIDHWVSISSVGSNDGEGLRSRAVKFRTNSSRKPVRLLKDLSDLQKCDGTTNVILNVQDNGANVSYSWEYSTNKGQSWKHISNNSSSYRIGTVRIADNGNLYRAKLTNSTCSDTLRSKAAKLRVDRPIFYAVKPVDPTLCIGQNATLSPAYTSINTPEFEWFWRKRPSDSWKSINSSDISLKVNNVSEANEGYYSIVLSNGCTSSQKRATAFLTVRPPLAIQTTADITACVGQGIPLVAKASGGNSRAYAFKWKSSEGEYLTDSIFVYPSVDVKWTASVFDNCSKDTISQNVNITMRDTLIVNLGSDQTICQGQSTKIEAVALGGDQDNLTYTWSDIGSGPANRLVNPRSTSSYSVTVSDACTKIDAIGQITVNVRKQLDVEIVASNPKPCFDQEIVLTATASGGLNTAYSFRWENGSTNPVRKLKLVSDWNFRVELDDACSDQKAYDTLNLVVRQPLQVSILGKDTACFGQLLNYTAEVTGGDSDNYEYYWEGIRGLKTMQFAPYLKNPIRLRVEDGCTPKSESTEKLIVVRDELNAALTLGEVKICKGQSVGIGFKPLGGDSRNYEILWSNGATDEFQNVQPEETTTYSFTLKDNCSSPEITGDIQVKVRPALTLDLGNNIQKCAEDSFSLKLNGQGGLESAHRYSVNDIELTDDQLKINNTSTKSYIVKLEDACTVEPAIDTLVVRVTPLESTEFELSSRAGRTANFESLASPNNVIWTWGDGFSSANSAEIVEHTFPDYGTYLVCKTESDNIGCAKTYCKEIDFYDPQGASNIEAVIYPNPSTGKVYVSTSRISGNYQIDLIDASGKTLIQLMGTNDSKDLFTLNLEPFSSGIYLLKTTLNGEVQNFKLIKTD